MFVGYWSWPEGALTAMLELWVHTSEVGSIDADGYLTFRDRKTDYLRRGGGNNSSFKMEGTYRNHPDTADAAVDAMPSRLTEDELEATAVLTEGASPRTPTGRVQKAPLSLEGATKPTWESNLSQLKVTNR